MSGDAATEAHTGSIAFTVNGRPVAVAAAPITRLADVLRDELGLTGTKIGCNAGDCGACTVLLDGRQVCACMVAVGQAEGRAVTTVEGLTEGLAEGTELNALQAAFRRHGAAQCGICTPGMLMAATDLLARHPTPDRAQVMDALGGVLCRCTGYIKIVEAVLDAAGADNTVEPAAGAAVGASISRIDALAKLTGTDPFAADAIPADALWLRVVRSPHARARFAVGDLEPFLAAHPGLVRVMTAEDIPFNGHGINPAIKDQPVLADGVVRYRGEAVVALVGERTAIAAIRDEELPIHYEPDEAVTDVAAAMKEDATLVQEDKSGNLLIEGYVTRGDTEGALGQCAAVAEGDFETAYVEHAYIEIEAGWARRIGERLELHVTTQAPYMNLEEVANILRISEDRVRIVPTACGGGFGGKLDVHLHGVLAVAAMAAERPVAAVYDRPESMASSTKRHPSTIHARLGCDRFGILQAMEMEADFNTGAYASFGPTVASRVPVHASGPYKIPNQRARGQAILTNGPPAGAFRGFGVPQAAIAHETLIDDLAEKLGIDRLELRLRNALRHGDTIGTGQVLEASVGMAPCLEALEPGWEAALQEAAAFNSKSSGAVRLGVGVGTMWYGIGQTGLPNPSAMHVVLNNDGTITLFNGAVDLGQGSTTVIVQICADAIGVPVESIGLVIGDTDCTRDAGKSSASRQTFISGKAAQIAGDDLRRKILARVNAGADSRIKIDGAVVKVDDGGATHEIDLSSLPATGDDDGEVLRGEGFFDPPTTALDDNGQGIPYATYGFAAQMAVVEADTALGTVKVLKIIAAHDVGRSINPQQVVGQIHGGTAQGLGLALLEEYIPGRTENLHDYLIPTFGDMPEMEVILVEDPEPLGPYGAKGVGEPGLIATAPAILGAIRHATGARLTRVPVLPHRLRAAILERA
ncbi:MAG TPA: molybdopterin cofactor-binding domain-containing protein [Rhodospirillales bacterium]|nr:molybdopterin cofactor-binding domain-containing protein [Rhodospirillales bacterium]